MGAVLRQARIQAGLSQLDVAKIVGATQSMVSRCELGNELPSLPQVRSMAAAFDTSPSALIELADLVKHRSEAILLLIAESDGCDSSLQSIEEAVGHEGLLHLARLARSILEPLRVAARQDAEPDPSDT